MHLHIDIETYSSVDIKSSGAYKYAESDDFEILMVAYAIDKEPTRCYAWEELPDGFFELLFDETVIKLAHNAAFERICFRAVGYDIPVEQWRCSAIKAAYCGLPMSLGGASVALGLGDKGKLSTGAALIRYFCMPVKATKTNGGRTRNLPSDNPQKWQEFKTYCVNDVEAEREIMHRLAKYKIPSSEWQAYFLDQKINDRGVRLDLQLAQKAIEADVYNMEALQGRLKKLTGLDNPNSLAQLRRWFHDQTGQEVKSLAKDAVEDLIAGLGAGVVREVLHLRQKTSKTSVKKYAAMIACAGKDQRARGLFQFYGAGRTGRWSGRLIQLQNLPRNYINDLDTARGLLKVLPFEDFDMCYDIGATLSQLIRTALVPNEGKKFGVADFSAIEARVLAWLAGEAWRLEVFATHGKIYEASASRMFNVPLEEIGKGSDLRQKGKVAELALGYQGGVGALKTMGGEKMGLSEQDMSTIVERWRKANPQIVQYWKDVENAAKRAIETRKAVCLVDLVFTASDESLQIELPSGRSLVYWNAMLVAGRYSTSIRYKGVNTLTKQWGWQDTYGGKLTENIVQAVSRDLLLHSMHALDDEGFYLVMHVHDEAVCEISQEEELAKMLDVMAHAPDWAQGLPLGADGYVCDFYKKD